MFKTLPVAAFVAVMSLSPAYAAGECTEALALVEKMRKYGINRKDLAAGF